MPIKLEAEYFDGAVKVVSTPVFPDHRGWYSYSYREDEFEAVGLPTCFVQANHSRSMKNVVRGLHFQLAPPMGKIMRVTRGTAFIVTVDIRPDSPRFLDWVGITTGEGGSQIWAPAGFARGFAALEDNTEVQYLTTGMYDSAGDSAICWNDSVIGIEWPVANAIVSKKDKDAPTTQELGWRKI